MEEEEEEEEEGVEVEEERKRVLRGSFEVSSAEKRPEAKPPFKTSKVT